MGGEYSACVFRLVTALLPVYGFPVVGRGAVIYHRVSIVKVHGCVCRVIAVINVIEWVP